MTHPENISDAIVCDTDCFGLVLAAAEHARAVGNTVIKWKAAPIRARCAAALQDVALDPDIRREAWRRLTERCRTTGEIDAPSEAEVADEEGLLKLLSKTSNGDDLAA